MPDRGKASRKSAASRSRCRASERSNSKLPPGLASERCSRPPRRPFISLAGVPFTDGAMGTKSTTGEQPLVAHNKIVGAPFEFSARVNLQSAVTAGEEYHRSFRIVGCHHDKALRDARTSRNIDHALRLCPRLMSHSEPSRNEKSAPSRHSTSLTSQGLFFPCSGS